MDGDDSVQLPRREARAQGQVPEGGRRRGQRQVARDRQLTEPVRQPQGVPAQGGGHARRALGSRRGPGAARAQALGRHQHVHNNKSKRLAHEHLRLGAQSLLRKHHPQWQGQHERQ